MNQRSFLVSGAGSGIGQAIALQIALASPHHQLILLGRNADRLEQTRAQLPKPEAHRLLIADIKDAKALASLISGARLESENLVAVIANAGIGGENHYGPADRWDEIIQTNLSGTYHLVNACLPALRKSREAYRHILIISSVLARLGVPKYSAYCASKAGLLGLTRSWAAEFAAERILVNAICPGWVETAMAEEGLASMAKALGRPLADVRKGEINRVPLKKMSRPEEIAALVGFLVSGAQTSISGQALDINGGAVMA